MLCTVLLSFVVCLCQLTHVTPTSINHLLQTFSDQTFKTVPFSVPRVASSKLGTTSPGFLFLSLFGRDIHAPAPLIMGEEGQLIWRPPTNGTTTWNGTIYHNLDVGYGAIDILDSTYTVIHTICGANLDITPVDGTEMPNGCKLDTNESKTTSRGTMLAIGRSVVSGVDLMPYGRPAEGSVLDSLFFEIDIPTGEVLFRWSAWENRDVLSPSRSHAAGPDTSGKPWDFCHMNSVDDVGDDYLVSSRYYWDAFMVNRHGEVKWVLNGDDGGTFTLPSNANFRFQHDVRAVRHPLYGLDDELELELHMYDNNNADSPHTTQPSSGLAVHLNLRTYTATLIRRLQGPENVGEPALQRLPDSASRTCLDRPGYTACSYGV